METRPIPASQSATFEIRPSTRLIGRSQVVMVRSNKEPFLTALLSAKSWRELLFRDLMATRAP
jgi:hypothetical protein